MAPPAVLLVLLSFLFAAGCRRTEPQVDAQATGTLTIASREPTSLDPAFFVAGQDFEVASNVHEGLFIWSREQGKAIPRLALRHEASPDMTHWRFEIDTSATYSDGSAVVAGDFVFAWNRLLDPATAAAGADALFLIQGARERAAGKGKTPAIEAPDDSTLIVTLEHPQPFFPELLTSPRFAPLPPRAFTDPAADLYSQPAPVSTGAYRLESWDRRQKMVLVSNPHHADAERLKLSRIEILFSESEETGLSWFRSGRVDLVYGLVPISRLSELRSSLGEELVFFPMRAVSYFIFNLARPPLDQLALRQALHAAIDRRLIVEDVLGAGQDEAWSFVPPLYRDSIGYRPHECARPNLPEALNLPAELTGAASGLELSCNSSETLKALLESTQHTLRERTGVHLAVRLLEWQTFITSMRSGDFAVGRLSLSGGPDPLDFLENFTSGHPNNYGGFALPEYDEAVAKVRAEGDPERRKSAMDEAQELLCKHLPATPVYSSSQVYLVRKSLLSTFHPNEEGVYLWKDL